MGINFQKVDFAYYIPKKKQNIRLILENIDLEISSKDEFIAIAGHTGSGKSTLVQLMNALLVPTAGVVEVMGHKVYAKHKTKLKPIRRHVGLVFQFPEYQIFEETVLKDILFGPKNFGIPIDQAENRAREIAKIIDLDESLMERSPFTLSGGQMRKVAIAGILASNPDVLILDEPTVGLDPFAKKELMEFLLKLHEMGKTILIITHDMEVVSRYCKRVVVLKQGEIVLDVSKEELFKRPDLLEAYSLDYPILLQILTKIKETFQLDMDVYQYHVEDAYQELRRALGEQDE
jgi:energy-coupling factor transport system ATP-binding protein